MLKLIQLAICSFILSAYAGSPGTHSQAKFELQKTSQKEIVDWINRLVKVSAPTRMIGTPGHQNAVRFLQEEIKRLDPKSSGKIVTQTFSPDAQEAKRFYQKDFDQKVEGKISKLHPDYQKWLRFTAYMGQNAERLKGNQGENIVWEKSGLDSSKVLIITAHYDTISHDPNTLLIREKDPMPGANYNASGVAVALGILKTLSNMDLNYSVRVVFLDWQGVGFLGSYQYAKDLKSSGVGVLGVINLEMLGQDTSYFDKTKKTGNMSVYLRASSEEEKWVRKLLDHGSKVVTSVSFEMKPNGFENSDNVRFWEQGFLSATFSQNWEDDFNPKFYQTPQDTPETLNHETLYHSYQFVGGAVLGTLLDLTK